VNQIDVYVMAFGGKGFDGLLPERMAVAIELCDTGIRADKAPKSTRSVFITQCF
jgi:histidyl-tRNA synthetase